MGATRAGGGAGAKGATPVASDFDVEWDEPTKGLGARKVPAKAGGGLKLGGTKPKVR